MSLKTAAALAIALCVAGAPDISGQTAQTPITRGKSITGSATIQAIDATARTLTLRDEKGQEDTFSVGPEIERFNELKVGDKVKMTYFESVVLQTRKAGEKPGETSTEAAVLRGTGPVPVGTVGIQDKMTVTVKAVDPAIPSITVTTSDGRDVTRRVDNKKNIEGVQVGDLIDITYTRALLTTIEREK